MNASVALACRHCIYRLDDYSAFAPRSVDLQAEDIEPIVIAQGVGTDGSVAEELDTRQKELIPHRRPHGITAALEP